MAASGKRKVVGIRRKRLPNGRYLQLYVLEGRGPRGGRTVGYVLTKKGTAGSSSAPTPSGARTANPAPSSGRPAVVVKRKRHGGGIYRRGRGK